MFHRGHALEGLEEALGGLGTPWVDVWEGLGGALVGLGDTLEDLLGGPWKNLGKNLLEEPSESTLTAKTPKLLRLTSF